MKKLADKVLLHLTVKSKYMVRKASYRLSIAIGRNARICNERKLLRHIPDSGFPNVFLQIPLEEIGKKIQIDRTLHDLIIKEGDYSLKNEWLILNEHRERMYDQNSGHYRWTEDFFTNYKYKNCFYLDVRRQKTAPYTDIKIPWETSRMQSLFSLAMAYRASSNEKYARKIIEIIRDFCDCCPYGTGVNWTVSMEVGIRISNILLACELIRDSQCFDKSFRSFHVVTVYEHMVHIWKNLENAKNGANHLLADLLGLAAASAAIPFIPQARRCAFYVQKMLRKELMRQVLTDGSHFEGSTSYQRLVGEILCFSIIAQQKLGFTLTEEENERLAKMGTFTVGLRMKNGLLPQLGDNDSGRVFQLAPENTRNHDSFINLVTSVTRACIVFPEKNDGFFLFYPEGTAIDSNRYIQSDIVEYSKFKAIRYQGNDVFIVMCGMTPELVNKAGHSHNDVLSLCLCVGEEEFIIDPGSGEYTGNRQIRHMLRSVSNHSTVSIDENEQRLFPMNPSLAFIWNSMAESDLRWEREGNVTIFTGTCRYKIPSGSVITHERKILISETSIRVQDSVSDMEKNCSIALPVFPGRLVDVENDTVSIFGKTHSIRISGSWSFTKDNSYYAEQYKKVIQNDVVRGISDVKDNWLQIEVLR